MTLEYHMPTEMVKSQGFALTSYVQLLRKQAKMLSQHTDSVSTWVRKTQMRHVHEVDWYSYPLLRAEELTSQSANYCSNLSEMADWLEQCMEEGVAVQRFHSFISHFDDLHNRYVHLSVGLMELSLQCIQYQAEEVIAAYKGKVPFKIDLYPKRSKSALASDDDRPSGIQAMARGLVPNLLPLLLQDNALIMRDYINLIHEAYDGMRDETKGTKTLTSHYMSLIRQLKELKKKYDEFEERALDGNYSTLQQIHQFETEKVFPRGVILTVSGIRSWTFMYYTEIMNLGYSALKTSWDIVLAKYLRLNGIKKDGGLTS